MEFGALGVIEKRRDFHALQGPGEPLHVVLHKNLHCRAFDRTGSLDRAVQPAADRHVSAQKNFGLRKSDCGKIAAEARQIVLHSWIFSNGDLNFRGTHRDRQFLLSEIRYPQSEIPRTSSGASLVSRCCLRLCIRKVCTSASAKRRGRSHRFECRNRPCHRESGRRRVRAFPKALLKL